MMLSALHELSAREDDAGTLEEGAEDAELRGRERHDAAGEPGLVALRVELRRAVRTGLLGEGRLTGRYARA